MSVDAYVKARAAFVSADAKVRDAGKMLSAVGDYLENKPSQFMFANASGLPGVGQRDSVPAEQWLSVAEIMALLSEWHRTRDLLKQAWALVDRASRDALQPPPPTSA